MRALDRKLWRDLAQLWSQALTIALVVASGVAGFITTLSAVDSLEAARDDFYVQARFADVFAALKRAPDSLAAGLRQLPGVAEVQTGTEFFVRVEVPGTDDPVIGQLVAVDRHQAQRLNVVSLRAGRPLVDEGSGNGVHTDGSISAWVSEGFAQARGLQPGAQVSALINGKRRTLHIVGVALSPEYVFAGFGGMPDMRGFGVFWLDRDVLAAAYDMGQAFNRVSLRLAPGASERAVADALTRALAPYGGRDAHGRDAQISNAMLDNEVKEQHVLGTVLPVIFLGVAAFLLNVVVSRLVATQREQIAALKALGYPNGRIARHYLQLVGLIVAAGLLLGVALGDRLGSMFTGLYAEFFHFPRFEHFIAPYLLAISIGITAVTAVGGTLNAILATVRLTPAEAMRPAAPGRYRPSIVERLGGHLGGWQFSPGLRMILRNMQRRPWRTTLAIAGVAASVAIVVTGNFIRDAMESIVDITFNQSMRSDVILGVPDVMDASTVNALARLPGAIRVEPARDVPVRFVHGHRSERASIFAWEAQPELRRIIDVDGRHVVPQGEGLWMTDRLAAKLGLRVGDQVLAEVLSGRQRTLNLRLAGTVQDMMGLNSYMVREALNEALGEGPLATHFNVAVERGSEPKLLAAVKQLPMVSAAFSKATLGRNMEEISQRNIRIMSTVLTLFASIIAVGVVYNNARIALAERAWELASLRVLGLTRAEVSALLLGEMAICIGVALPLGMWAGNGLVHLIVQQLKSDQFFFPVVILPRTYAWAALAVLAAGVGSALVVRQRIDKLDMVAALKTRE
jgi:putative ABC transport system permease protein